MADSKNIDAAVIAKLAGDATLTTLAPGGIYLDASPQGVDEPFGIVTLVSHEDNYQIGGASYESALYLVKFVKKDKSVLAVQAAASRAHALLQKAVLAVTGYSCMECSREERVAYVEPVANSDIRFQHRGGYYRVIVEALS